ncbi:MAG TPA: hypothetical protein VMH91_01340 [Candidatus Paceibacterota bacterium]|nr:hypothetical protein [Candidatus Paceibacterota bacterium]
MPEKTEKALKALQDLAFTLQEQARSFGFEPEVVTDTNSLRSWLAKSRDVLVRAEVIVRLKFMLDAVFGANEENNDATERWINVKHNELGRRSLKELMTSGDMDDLRLALSTVEKVVG